MSRIPVVAGAPQMVSATAQDQKVITAQGGTVLYLNTDGSGSLAAGSSLRVQNDTTLTVAADRAYAVVVDVYGALDSVASGTEAVYRSRSAPNLLDYMDGVQPDGVTSNSEEIAEAVAAAITDGHGKVKLPAVAEQWCVDEPLPMTVNWEGDGRDTNGTRVKALPGFDGEGVFDLSSTSNVLRTVENLKVDCGHVPGVQAFAGGDAIGAGTGLARNIHIQNCAPGPCTRLTAGVTLGGTKTLAVESTAGFKKGSILPAGSTTQPVVTSVDSSTQLTVSGGSGTLASGLAIEQPTYAIGTRPLDSVSTGAMTGWLLDGVQLNNCAHWLRLPTPAGDDINTRSLRASAYTLATASTTLAADFVAGTDTTVTLTSATAHRTSGRTVIGGYDVWYSGKSGNTLTGVYTAHVGTIASGTAVSQYNRPILWPIDVSSVNMRFTSSYFALGKTDMVANGGIKAAFRLGGNEIKFDGTFFESVEEVGWTHLLHTTDPGAEVTVDGLTLNVTSVTSFTALIRSALSSMSANQRKRITVRNVDSLSNDLLDGYPILDVFVDTDAESDPNGLDFHVEGVNDMTKLGRFGASSTTSASGAGVVRVTGTWKGARLDDNLACLTANADWPDIISHYVLSSGTPEGSITARPGSTCTSRRLGSGTNGSFYPVRWVKATGSSNTGWVGQLIGSGVPDYDATVGSTWLDVANGVTWQKVVSGATGWQAQADGCLTAWVTSSTQNPTLGALPANVYVTGVDIYVHEAFNSDGTDNITVGRDSLPDALADDTDVSTTGEKTPTAGTGARHYTTTQTVEAYYTNSGSEPTTGKALVTVGYRVVPAVPA